MRRIALLSLATIGLLAVTTAPAQAAAPPPPPPPTPADAVVWNMNESAGATVMLDSGPRGLNGTIDPTGVQTGWSMAGVTGYSWVHRPPEQGPPSPERIIQVPDNPYLDAGSDTFTIEIRYRTKENFGNIIQKGQAHTVGGQWKIQNPHGIPSCLFTGKSGRVATAAKTPLNDNQWHVLTCVKTPTSVTMYVDGVYRNKKNGTTGVIDNKKPVTVGGKIECDQIRVTCDYYSGQIDYVKISHTA